MDDARAVADRLDIPFYVLNCESEFQSKVIDPFVESYLQGETPIPCVNCNTYLKFDQDKINLSEDNLLDYFWKNLSGVKKFRYRKKGNFLHFKVEMQDKIEALSLLGRYLELRDLR